MDSKSFKKNKVESPTNGESTQKRTKSINLYKILDSKSKKASIWSPLFAKNTRKKLPDGFSPLGEFIKRHSP